MRSFARFLMVALCAAAAAATPGTGGARTTRTCPAFTGPAWTYTNGIEAAGAPVYAGTRYTFTVLRLSCAKGLALIRQVIVKTARPPGPAALRYVKGYACAPASRWLYGKKMVAGQCFAGGAAGPNLRGGSFTWAPSTKDPSSKRIR